jgi:hypothetical protein
LKFEKWRCGTTKENKLISFQHEQKEVIAVHKMFLFSSISGNESNYSSDDEDSKEELLYYFWEMSTDSKSKNVKLKESKQ